MARETTRVLCNSARISLTAGSKISLTRSSRHSSVDYVFTVSNPQTWFKQILAGTLMAAAQQRGNCLCFPASESLARDGLKTERLLVSTWWNNEG